MRDWKFILLNTWPPRFLFCLLAILAARLQEAAAGDRPLDLRVFTNLPVMVVLAIGVLAMFSKPVRPAMAKPEFDVPVWSRQKRRTHRPRLWVFLGAMAFAALDLVDGVADGDLRFGTPDELLWSASRLGLIFVAGAAVTWLFVPLPQRPSSETHRLGDQSPTS